MFGVWITRPLVSTNPLIRSRLDRFVRQLAKDVSHSADSSGSKELDRYETPASVDLAFTKDAGHRDGPNLSVDTQSAHWPAMPISPHVQQLLHPGRQQVRFPFRFDPRCVANYPLQSVLSRWRRPPLSTAHCQETDQVTRLNAGYYVIQAIIGVGCHGLRRC